MQSANENIVNALNRFGDDGSAWTNLALLNPAYGAAAPSERQGCFLPYFLASGLETFPEKVFVLVG